MIYIAESKSFEERSRCCTNNVLPIGRDNKNLRIFHIQQDSPFPITILPENKLIGENKKFIVILETNFKKCLEKNVSDKFILKKILTQPVIDAINNNRCLLCFDLCRDRHLENYSRRENTLLSLLYNANINNISQIRIITSLKYEDAIKPKIKTIFWEYYESFAQNLMNYNVDYEQRLNAKYRFLYLNRRFKLFRLYIFMRLYKEIPNFSKLFAATFNYDFKWYGNLENRTYKHIFEKDIKFLNTELMRPLQEHYKKTNIVFKKIMLKHFNISCSNHNNLLTDTETDLYQENIMWNNVQLYFAPEAVYDSQYASSDSIPPDIFYTEKTFKAIKAKLPFIIYGQAGLLKRLQEYGYKTFNTLWDESYDQIVDHVERADKIINLIKYLSALNHDEINDIISSAKDIVNHNYQHLYRRAPANEMFSAFNRFCNQ